MDVWRIAMNRLRKWLGPYGTVFWLITGAPAFAADLTIWWTRGYYPEEDEGIRRIVADFERDTGQNVELSWSALNKSILGGVEGGEGGSGVGGEQTE
jgi:hypothetical protein